MNRSLIETMYRRYGPMVLRRARSLLRDESAANDALQEVFLRALRSSSDFRGDASPVTWLYRITTNHCLNQIRDTARRVELMSENPPAPAETHPVEEARLTVQQLLRQLPDQLREVSIYYYIDEMKQEEIAALLGISRRTVGNRLDSIRATLRAKLQTPRELNHGKTPSIR